MILCITLLQLFKVVLLLILVLEAGEIAVPIYWFEVTRKHVREQLLHTNRGGDGTVDSRAYLMPWDS
jgi:hypothetical protein